MVEIFVKAEKENHVLICDSDDDDGSRAGRHPETMAPGLLPSRHRLGRASPVLW